MESYWWTLRRQTPMWRMNWEKPQEWKPIIKNVSIVQVRDRSDLKWGGSDRDEKKRCWDSRGTEEAESIKWDSKGQLQQKPLSWFL